VEVKAGVEKIARSLDYPCAKCLQPNTVWLAKQLKAHREIQAKLTTIGVSTMRRLLSPNRRVMNLIAHLKRHPQASYDQPWLYHNFYQRVMRLHEKHLGTGAIKRIYDSTQTPLDRLCRAKSLTTLYQVQLLALPRLFSPLQPRQDIQDLID